MTEKERTMHAGSTGGDHLDEGTIHAWLDDALDAESAARVEAHVSTCPACAELVAEARGLIAGASRIVRALDDEPSAAAPAWGTTSATRAGESRRWRFVRVTPARAAIAATLLVALGVTLTRPRAAVDTVTTASRTATITESAPTAKPDDHVLDSAIRRNLAQAQPPRSVEAVEGPAVPTMPPALSSGVASADVSAPGRVAAGRAAMRAMLDSSAPIADQSRTATAGGSAVAAKQAIAAAAKAESAGTAQSLSARLNEVVTTASGDARLRETECFRVESVAPGATWGPVALPIVVALNRSGGGGQPVGYAESARILDPASGADRGVPITWTRRTADSVELDLVRTSYRGTLELGGTGDLRGGSMRSEPAPRDERFSAGTDTSAPSEPGRAALRVKRRVAAAQIPAAKEPVAAPPPVPSAHAGSAVPIVARRVNCPVP
jgi:hypothetical protein